MCNGMYVHSTDVISVVEKVILHTTVEPTGGIYHTQKS